MQLERQQFVNKPLYNVGDSTVNGIFMPSADINSEYIFPENQWLTNFTLTFNKEWVLNEFLEKVSLNMLYITKWKKPIKC